MRKYIGVQLCIKKAKQTEVKRSDFSVHKIKELVGLPLHSDPSAGVQPKWKWICLKKSICLLQNGMFERLAKCLH